MNVIHRTNIRRAADLLVCLLMTAGAVSHARIDAELASAGLNPSLKFAAVKADARLHLTVTNNIASIALA